MGSMVYKKASDFKRKYPLTIGWRLRQHCNVIEKFLNPGEEVKYAFCGQKSWSSLDFFSTYVVVMTNKRILLATKRVLWGYLYNVITPDMFNDLKVKAGMIWSKVVLDTVKEVVVLSNIQRSAGYEIQQSITQYIMEEKKKYGRLGRDKDK